MAMPALRTPDEASSAPASATLVAVDGRALPLRATALRARAKGGLARTVVRQTFVNPHAEALEVVYQLPLPVDGAVSGFRFELDGEVVQGEVDRRDRARARYEEALVEGRTAALLDQERASLFTQRVGNIPPGATVVCEVTVDQRLAWLDEGAWEWRFPATVGPRYLGAAGRVPDADAVRAHVADGDTGQRVTLELTVADAIPRGYSPESPTHALGDAPADVDDASLWGYRRAPLRERDPGAVAVRLAAREGVRADRDLVVRWPVADAEPGASLDVSVASDGARYGVLTLVPPATSSRMRALPRDLVVLVDTSGSMGGRPLEQAARVVCAMIDTLGPDDRLELVEFSSSPRRWKAEAVPATEAYKREASQWVRGLRAGGATEMRAALLEALRPLRGGAQRQVVLVTDGYIGFEREIVETVYRALPTGCRLHTLGVGSSVNRALTGPAAQAGRGLEIVLGLDEDAERAARRMVARTDAPLVTELTVEGDGVLEVAPARAPDLFAGSPVLLSLRLGPPGSTVRVRGASARGTWQHTVTVPERAGEGEAARARFARDRVEDCELHLAAGGVASELDAEVERLGLAHQIATRLTSWVAVSRRRHVEGDVPTRAEVMPHALPDGVSAEGVGLRAPVAGPVAHAFAAYGAMAGPGSEGSVMTTGAYPVSAPSAGSVRAQRAAPAPSMHVYVPAQDAHASSPEVYATRARRTSPWLLLAALLALVALLVAGWFVYRTIASDAPRPAVSAPRRQPPA